MPYGVKLLLCKKYRYMFFVVLTFDLLFFIYIACFKGLVVCGGQNKSLFLVFFPNPFSMWKNMYTGARLLEKISQININQRNYNCNFFDINLVLFERKGRGRGKGPPPPYVKEPSETGIYFQFIWQNSWKLKIKYQNISYQNISDFLTCNYFRQRSVTSEFQP